MPEPAGPVGVTGRLVLTGRRVALGDLRLDDFSYLILGEGAARGLASSQSSGATSDVLMASGRWRRCSGIRALGNRFGIADGAQRRPQRRGGCRDEALHGGRPVHLVVLASKPP